MVLCVLTELFLSSVVYSSQIKALARFIHLFTIQYKHVYTIYVLIVILLSSLHSSLSASHLPQSSLSTATLSLGKHHYWLRPSRRSSLLIDIFPASLSSLAAAVPTLPYGTLHAPSLKVPVTGDVKGCPFNSRWQVMPLSWTFHQFSFTYICILIKVFIS